MGEEFTRPKEGSRFAFAGLKTNALPDALPSGKYALATNIRATQDDAIVTRPGQSLVLATGPALPITDLRTYAALFTDDRPRVLARDIDDLIWLGPKVGTAAVRAGSLSPGGLGAMMLPFRPNASPTPWMYIANGADYQKLSSPDAADVVTQANVGIAEPQSPPDAYLSGVSSVYVDTASNTPPFTPTGTMGSISASGRTTDTVVAVFIDPAAMSSGPAPVTLQVGSAVPYQRFQKLVIGAAANVRFVQDVFTPIPKSMISSIFYYTGTIGRCVVVPGGPPGFSQGPGATSDSLYSALLLSSLRRGALVQIGSEVCFVLSVTTGPGGTVCFETTTTSAHTAAETLDGIPAIQVLDAQTTAPGDALSSPDYSAAVTVGIGIATATLGADTSELKRPTSFTNPSPFFVIPPNLPWANPANAFDGNPSTFASTALTSNSHSSCQWQGWGAPGFTYATVNLYVDSEVPPPVDGGSWGAVLQYSPDAGVTWYDIYRVGGFGGAGSRLRQTDVISLPPGITLSQLIVRVSTDTLNNVSAFQNVYEIWTVGVAAGPFTSPFILQPDDYVHFSINVDDLSMLIEAKILFHLDTDNFYYYTVRPSDLAAAVANSQTQIAAAQTIEQRAIIDEIDAAASGNQAQTSSSAQTPPGSAQWAEITFPISSLTRVGNDQTLSLADAATVALLFNASGTINVLWNSIFVFGGYQGDVGDIGAPYLYRIRPRSQVTGVVGNPSPATRYGVSPRRQRVTVSLPSAVYDTQIDTWDIFRYGGTVTSWRYIGSTPSSSVSFPDNYADEAADAGNSLDFDNFEPWPTIDVPNNGTAATVTGTTAVVSSLDVDIARYLPGTLVQLGGLNAYTLWTRPIPLDFALFGVFTTGTHLPVAQVTLAPGVTTANIHVGDVLYIQGNSFAAFNGLQITVTLVLSLTEFLVFATAFSAYSADVGGTGGFVSAQLGSAGNRYLLQFVENAGAAMTVPYAIQEPALAREPLPYLWGPDANGTVFACGDPYRPGTLYFSKPNAPDSAPDSFNTEITPPSEPLLGGEVLDGLSLVASTERWWALYPSRVFAGIGATGTLSQNYNIVQQPIPRGLAAPYGHHTDGVSIFFWAKDGIWSSTKGSLTDADLYNLFPHDGVPGVAVTYAGVTLQPPDYSRAGTFRLEYSAGYLYAVYEDFTGFRYTLVYDLHRSAWSVDVYTPSVTAFCHPDQQAGTVLSSTTRYPELLMATVDGRVASQTPAANDLDGTPIPCIVATGEFDGGDLRAPKQWGDLFLDLIPAAAGMVNGGTGVEVELMSRGAVAPGFVLPRFVAQSASRVRAAFSPEAIIVADFLGVLLTWVDDFRLQAVPTTLFVWQPSYVIQPARTIEWFTFGTSFGVDGYLHIREIAVAWVSSTPITLTITSFDGQSPAPLVIPSSGGAYQKVMFPLTANKGQLYKFRATSAAEFQFFFDDWEVHVGAWRRQGPYATVKGLGGRPIDAAPI